MRRSEHVRDAIRQPGTHLIAALGEPQNTRARSAPGNRPLSASRPTASTTTSPPPANPSGRNRWPPTPVNNGAEHSRTSPEPSATSAATPIAATDTTSERRRTQGLGCPLGADESSSDPWFVTPAQASRWGRAMRRHGAQSRRVPAARDACSSASSTRVPSAPTSGTGPTRLRIAAVLALASVLVFARQLDTDRAPQANAYSNLVPSQNPRSFAPSAEPCERFSLLGT